MEYYSAIKKNECSNTDGPRDYHTQWNKSETNITWYCLYVESLKKKDKMNLFKKLKQTHRLRKQTDDCQREKVGEG